VIALSAIIILVRNGDHARKAQEKAGGKKQLPQTATTRESLPDQSAFYATYGISDPEKKLQALEKFIADFPKSSQIGSALREAFKATVKRWPDDRKRMLHAANRMIRPAAEAGASTANILEYHFLAQELLSAGVFLKEAETWALKSLDFRKEQFVEAQKKKYAEWKRPLPPDEVMNKKYISEQASYRTTLGRIYLKQGKTAEGEKILKEAHMADPLLSQAAIGLAEIAEKRGDNAAAVDYLTTATLTAGYSIADARGRLEAAYKKLHAGSIDGLENQLDARYRKLFPNPVKVERYKPPASRSNRVVLAELFTGAG
jgi:tetratricopeptide (TPR) repeat protein